jgi:hypothetical protein
VRVRPVVLSLLAAASAVVIRDAYASLGSNVFWTPDPLSAVRAGSARASGPAGSVPLRTWVRNGPVYEVEVVGDTAYLGGAFTQVGPRTGPGAGIDAATGEPDLDLAEIGRGEVWAVVPDGLGGWYIGGWFAYVGGLPRNRQPPRAAPRRARDDCRRRTERPRRRRSGSAGNSAPLPAPSPGRRSEPRASLPA